MIGIIVNCILQSAADRKTFQPEIKKLESRLGMISGGRFYWRVSIKLWWSNHPAPELSQNNLQVRKFTFRQMQSNDKYLVTYIRCLKPRKLIHII